MITVKHRGNLGSADTSNALSPNIWSRIPYNQIRDGRKAGHFFRFDAASPAASVFASATVQAGAKTIQDTGCTVTLHAGVDGGQLELAGADAAGDDCGIELCGGGVGGSFSISSARYKKVAFEMRVNFNLLAQGGFFAGLAKPGFAAAGALADTTAALSDKDLVGFHVANATAAVTAAVDCVFKKTGQTAQVNGNDVQTLSIDTYYKLGMLFTPYVTPALHRLEWFIDNILVSTYEAAMTATSFPDGVYLVPALVIKSLDTNEHKARLPWAQACMQF